MRDDAAPVIAARTGEPDAFGPLVEGWLDRCWEVAWRILHDRDLAPDVAQETLLTSWQQLDRLDMPASFGGWVLRIARSRALDRLERERRAVPTGDPELLEPLGRPSGEDDPVAALGRAEQHDLVWAAAAALGERDASILDLHLRHGLEPAELADELGIAPNAAHQALFHLRRRPGGAVLRGPAGGHPGGRARGDPRRAGTGRCPGRSPATGRGCRLRRCRCVRGSDGAVGGHDDHHRCRHG